MLAAASFALLLFDVALVGVGEVSRAEMPALWAVVDSAQAAVGAPRVDILLTTNEFNAACARSGIRRRVVLELGLPLCAVLSPDGQQALLGHELGHLVNGDPTTGFLTQPALTTFGRLAEIFDPRGLVDADNMVAAMFATVLAYTVFLPVQRACEWAHRGLVRVARQDHQRAEVYADALAVRLGGTKGATELLDVLLHEQTAVGALRKSARAESDPRAWRKAVSAAIVPETDRRRIAEQLSLRFNASPYLTHPPAGLRARLVRSWPAFEAAVAVPTAELAGADLSLARRYVSARRAIERHEI